MPEDSSICGGEAASRMGPGKLRSQAKACEELLEAALEAAFSKGIPADNFLSSVFRSRRAIGSRDRKLFSQAIFAAFRWRGWLMLIPDCASEDAQRAVPLMLLGALAAEGSCVPAAANWAASAGIEFAAYEEACRRGAPQERMAAFAPLCGCAGCKFDDWNLVPEWARKELEPSAAKGELLDFLQRRPPLWLRSQTDGMDRLFSAFRREGAEVQAHPQVAGAFKVSSGRLNLPSMAEFKEGLFEAQDISSQCIGIACLPKPGERWWDACAGAGGKSLQLACLMRGGGEVLATDARGRKLEDLRKRAARASLLNIKIGFWDGSKAPAESPFDGVLVDAPCSSSGRWRRNPDARWIATKAWASEFPEIQFKILSAAAAGVRPGGALVYATCSFFEEENGGVVSRFLKSRPDFRLDSFPNPLDGSVANGTLSVMPWDADCDASFMARFHRSKI